MEKNSAITVGSGMFTTFGMALASAYSDANQATRDDAGLPDHDDVGDVDPAYNLYRNSIGAYVQMSSPLDGRFDDELAAEIDAIASRVEGFGLEGAWSEDDVGHTIGLETEAVGCCHPPTEVEYDDEYSVMAREAHVVDSNAETVYHRGVSSLIRRFAGRGHRRGRRREPRRGYFVSQRQIDAGSQAYAEAQLRFRRLSDHEVDEWLRGDEKVERHYARLDAERR